MKSADILYDLLQNKTSGQIFYNQMMVRAVNPLAVDLFKTFRDDEEKDLAIIRRRLLAQEAKPAVLKSFIPGRNP
ncbi:MAG: hypothetical protein ACYC4H_03185 [Desulfocucumaceae bacterium]